MSSRLSQCRKISVSFQLESSIIIDALAEPTLAMRLNSQRSLMKKLLAKRMRVVAQFIQCISGR